MVESKNGLSFKIHNRPLKQGRPGYRLGLLNIKSYNDEKLSLLNTAGVNTAEFVAGSTRSAACSKVSSKGLPLDEVMAAGG